MSCQKLQLRPHQPFEDVYFPRYPGAKRCTRQKSQEKHTQIIVALLLLPIASQFPRAYKTPKQTTSLLLFRPDASEDASVDIFRLRVWGISRSYVHTNHMYRRLEIRAIIKHITQCCACAAREKVRKVDQSVDQLTVHQSGRVLSTHN